MSPFLEWGDLHARSRFARSTIPEEKWGTTRSLPKKCFQRVKADLFEANISADKIRLLHEHFFVCLGEGTK